MKLLQILGLSLIITLGVSSKSVQAGDGRAWAEFGLGIADAYVNRRYYPRYYAPYSYPYNYTLPYVDYYVPYSPYSVLPPRVYGGYYNKRRYRKHYRNHHHRHHRKHWKRHYKYRH